MFANLKKAIKKSVADKKGASKDTVAEKRKGVLKNRLAALKKDSKDSKKAEKGEDPAEEAAESPEEEAAEEGK